MIGYMQGNNNIYISNFKDSESINSISSKYIFMLETSELYKITRLKDILTAFTDSDFKIENIQEISEFLANLKGNLAQDFVTFLQQTKDKIDNKVEIFFIDEESSQGIYISIIFDNNTDFETVDKKINELYNILEEINNDLWFVNIGEKFNEP